jgi:hypothetical protein
MWNFGRRPDFRNLVYRRAAKNESSSAKLTENVAIPIDAAGKFGVQHPARKAAGGFHLNPSLRDAILNDLGVARVLGTATGAVRLHSGPKVISFVPDTSCPDIGVAFAKDLVSKNDISGLQANIRLGFRDDDSVWLSRDVYSREHRYLLSRCQSANLSALGLPGRIYGRAAFDCPVKATIGEARLLFDDWKIWLSDFRVG